MFEIVYFLAVQPFSPLSALCDLLFPFHFSFVSSISRLKIEPLIRAHQTLMGIENFTTKHAKDTKGEGTRERDGDSRFNEGGVWKRGPG